MDPQERLFLESVWQCIEDAGYTPDQLSHNKLGDNRSDVGVYAGVSFNTYSLLGARDFEQDSDVPINSQSYSVANRISYLLNLSGPSLSVDTACSSSLYAIHLACQGIINGECEMAIAGGVNLTLHPSKYVMLSNGKFLAEDGHCRSFGEGGSGYVPGEGVGAILLKSLSQAEKDKDHIYAVIKATAINHGGRTHGYSVPNPVAQTEVIEKALNKANIDPRTITYVEAHGTGTELGDPIEITALTEAFNKYTSDKQYCAIGSVKSNIGHLEAAAGVSQVIKVLLQMKYKRLFPSLLNADQVNHNIDFRGTPFYVQIKDEIWRSEGLRRAGISSFGVGGVNVHMILEEYSKQPEEEEKTHNTEVVFPISSRSQEGVREYVKLFKAYLENNINAFKSSKINRLPRMEDIAFTLFNGRIRLPYRIAFVAKNYEELLALMDSYLKGISQPKIFEGKVRDKYSKCMAEGLGEKPFELATMWIQYEKIPDDIYKEYASIKVALPTYPFEKEAYWCYKRNEIKEQTPIIAATIKENRIVEQVEENKNTNQLLDIEFLTELTNELESNRLELMMKYIQNIFAQLLGFSEGKMPDVEQGYFEMGLESIETKQAYIKMQDALGVELSEQVFFNYPNIYETSQYILSLIDFDELEEKLESGELDQELESNQAEEIKEIDKQIVNTNMADIMKEVVISEEIQNISDDEVIRQLKELLDESGIA